MASAVVELIDRELDAALDGLRSKPGADAVFYVASQAADYSMLWHGIGIALAATDPARRRHTFRLAAALGVESLVVNQGLKRVLRRSRPAGDGNASFAVRQPTTGSFPSGHASSATLAAVLLGEAAPKLRPLWVVLAGTVATSRVYNRMHHPSDVAAGFGVGLLFAALSKRLWPLR